MSKMDPRFRPISIEIALTIAAFIIIFQTGILPRDSTNLYTVLFFFLFIIQLVRILIKLRGLRKAGVNLTEQGLRSPLADTINPEMGNRVAKFNKTRLIIIVIIVAFLLIQEFMSIFDR